MVTHPDPAILYPDIAAHSSLGAALQAVAVRDGFSIPIADWTSHPLSHVKVPSALPHRNALRVSSWPSQRQWSIRGEESCQGTALVEGGTDDLTEIARAARAWHDGAELGEIHRRAPFVHLTGRFEVPDHDPVRLAEAEWQHLRKQAGELEWPGPPYQALIEAAYAEPALRALYPFTSHWVLRFAITTRPGLATVGPCLHALATGRYTVSTDIFGDNVLAQATTAQEAVSAAVRYLPPDLGPVVSGAGFGDDFGDDIGADFGSA